ncbi:MAG: family transposase [Actinomycetia bacterium]|nr:family transposase [Actinomycetes bacterium]
MAELACAYDAAPVPRAPEDVIATPVQKRKKKKAQAARPKGKQKPREPQARGKWLTASVTDGIPAVIAAAFDEAERRDPGHSREWVVLIDGNNTQIEAVTAEAARRDVTVTIVIDFIHVLEYCWKSAWSFFDKGERAAEEWVADQARKILHGKARQVAAGIRRRATTYGYSGPERAGADECARYLDNKQDYPGYATALRKGWPIATGIIEGACRHIKHLLSLTSPRRALLFTCGWMITAADEQAIALLPASAWKPGITQDGEIEEDKDVAEITHLMSRAGNWPGGLRWICRRVKPSRRQVKNLTAYEKKTGWRYSITCTNIPGSGIDGVPGSHHPQYIDVVHREHACVETAGVRTAKAMGLRALPSKAWQVNAGWVIAANIAADLAAWTRLLGHHDDAGLRDNPDTLRYRVWHLPARLARHARQRTLAISPDWPWADAFLTCWQRLFALPAPA